MRKKEKEDKKKKQKEENKKKQEEEKKKEMKKQDKEEKDGEAMMMEEKDTDRGHGQAPASTNPHVEKSLSKIEEFCLAPTGAQGVKKLSVHASVCDTCYAQD